MGSLAGQVDDQIITLTLGSIGDYDAENLSSATVDVEIAGSSGSATVRVSTTLNANITGSGSVFYHDRGLHVWLIHGISANTLLVTGGDGVS